MAADGSAWEIDGEEIALNPRHTLEPIYFDLAQLWLACRGSDGGLNLLPEPGGVLDQGAWLIEALEVMDGQAARLRKTGGANQD